MEIRCDNCSHVGPAAEVRPGTDGVVLVCENCGHENLLDVGHAPREEVGAATEDQPPTDGDVERDAGDKAARAKTPDTFGDKEQVRMWLREDALKALIPEPGPGPRCLKCAHLLEPEAENCSRCGLNRAEAIRFGPGEAPWERPPAGKESEYEQAELLWESFADDPSAQRLSKFVEFVRGEELLDLGIRRLRFYLIDEPDDDAAIDHLRELAESLQSRIIVATVQAKASASEFQEDVNRFKQRMMVVGLVILVALFLLFLAFFWDNCSSGMPQL